MAPNSILEGLMEADAVSFERTLVSNYRPLMDGRACNNGSVQTLNFSRSATVTFNNCIVMPSDTNLTIFAYFNDFSGPYLDSGYSKASIYREKVSLLRVFLFGHTIYWPIN